MKKKIGNFLVVEKRKVLLLLAQLKIKIMQIVISLLTKRVRWHLQQHIGHIN